GCWTDRPRDYSRRPGGPRNWPLPRDPPTTLDSPKRTLRDDIRSRCPPDRRAEVERRADVRPPRPRLLTADVEDCRGWGTLGRVARVAIGWAPVDQEHRVRAGDQLPPW